MSKINADDFSPTSAIVGGAFYQGGYIRIFCQRSNGTLGAVYSNNGTSATPTWGNAVIVADTSLVKKDTPLALVLFGWSNPSDFTSRIFYLGSNNEIRWYGVRDSKGAHGVVTLKNDSQVHAAPYSKLGAFTWTENDKPHIRVAYQRPDNTIAQLNWDGSDDFKFTEGPASPPTAAGTYLAFVNQAPKNSPQYFRGYYEHSTNQIMELINEPAQNYIGTMINGQSTIRPNAVLAAAAGPSQAAKQGRVSVLWQNDRGGVTRAMFSGGGWQAPQDVAGVSLYDGGKFATFIWSPNDSQENVLERVVWAGRDGGLWYQNI